MFIYHFNRLIRSRVLWIIFATVVAFAFLSVDSCSTSSRSDNQSAGRLGGSKIDAATYDFTRRFIAGSRSRASDLPPAMVETQTWQHLAALKSAGDMGILSTQEEVRQAILETPAFANQGRFDAALYRQVISQSMGIAPAHFERLMADQIVIAKLARTVGTAGLVSAMEIEDRVAALTDRFTVRCITISNRFASAEIAIDDDAMRQYYDENRAAFALPDRVAVRYAALPVTNFTAFVTVPEEDVRDFYDYNSTRFTRATTNNTLETLPLEDVREEILAEMRLDEARYVAGTNMTAFMDSLTASDFEQFSWRARARRMTVGSTALFAADEYVPGVETSAQEEFRNAAFDLDTDRTDARFAVVPGSEHVYLLMAWTNSPAYTPAFEEVRGQARPMALADARQKAFSRLCDDERAALLQALERGEDLAAAAAARALNVTTALTFTVLSAAPASFPSAQVVIPAAINLRKGELSEAQPVYNGALLIHVDDRQEGDTLTAGMLRDRIREELSRPRSSALLGDWMKWNLDRLGFTTARPATYYTPEELAEAEAGDY